jgi:signal peptidase I
VACALAEEVVRKFGTVRLRVIGNSMVPSIMPGDVITVRQGSLNEIYLGDLVLCTRERGFAVHRVAAKTNCFGECFLLTRGDRLRHDDPPVSSATLLGRVESIERAGYQFHPADSLNIWERMIAPLLRTSDRATYAYLEIVGACRKIYLGDQRNQRENCHSTR